MDSEEKKPKRPRIGENRIAASSDGDAQHYGKVNYDQPSDYQSSGEHTQGDYQRERNYQPRPYNNNRQQGGYGNNRYNQGGYRQGNNYNNRYNQGGYQPRQQYQSPAASEGAESTTPAEGTSMSEGYTPSTQQEGGYNNNRQQGGYNNNRQQGGYNNRQQGGYNNNRQQGPNRQGGYNNRRQQGPNRQGFNAPRQGKSFTPRPKRIEYEMPIPDPNEQIRLNKFMANAGICSRREADEFIQQGLVKVNGEVVTELGTKISHSDVVEYDEKVVTLESKCYILLNKPKDCVTTSDDPNGRTTVMDLVKGACNERIYPVGRLDRNTTGVLLLTNDGDLASKLTHPKYVKKKIYHVWTDKDISEDDMQAIADGIELEDGPIHADAISYATENDRNQAGIEIHSGRNRIVRRIFESLGYHVTKLDRVYFAGLTKKNLPRGRWRYLTQEEVNFLKMGSFE
ncbi:pseudouridine synthase [uncultured Muribaculum sp.]|uniref:pseudouridine synthase n=1 Tax=uncultured Muribaculum sp. TaxID=1918613 RepID=UPI0025B67667|nr:pseudouridine synthase [uncultured Muribaculum sp.]